MVDSPLLTDERASFGPCVMSILMIDIASYLAVAFVLCSASTNNVKWFRLASLAASICFVIYGAHDGLIPLVFLHCIMGPLNLIQFLRAWTLQGGHTSRIPTNS